MQDFAIFRPAPLAGIQPEGWLRRYLEIQRDGLTGHLEHSGFPFDTGGWLAPKVKHRDGDTWWPYEQTAYWIDGMTSCGHLLRDPFLIRKSSRPIDHVIDHPDHDGYLGPAFLKGPDKLLLRWPHAVLFRAVMARHAATGDARIVPALSRHYLSGTSPHSNRRDICNIEAILWTYRQTGDRRLLDHALAAYEHFNKTPNSWYPSLADLKSAKRPTHHGVTYNEIAKLAAIVYIHTGRRDILAAAVNGYRKLDRFAMLVDGVHSSAEHIAGKDALASHETCDIADFTWGIGYLLLATGKAEYADKIERACFNAAPGAVRPDFKALQYFSCPNQVITDARSNHNEFSRGLRWMSYRPNPGTECCPGAVNRIMPNYVARMWTLDRAGDPVATFYGPSRFAFDAKGTAVTIVEDTAYPFADRLDFLIQADKPARFGLTLRIPGWCRAAQVLVNGVAAKTRLKAGTFTTVRRTFAPNDRITLILPMPLRLSHWPDGGVAVERGPLVFALRIAEDWRKDPKDPKSSREFPAWNLYPASPWNYALDLDAKDPLADIEVIHRPLTPEPWSQANAPIELRVPARRVRGWKLIRRHREKLATGEVDGTKTYAMVPGDYRYTPPLPDPATLRGRLGKREFVTLIPYGCTRLRVTVFPRA